MNNLNGNRKNEFRRKQEEKQRKLALKIKDEAGELREGSLKSEEAIPSLDELCAMGERVEQQTTFSAKEAIRNKIKARRDEKYTKVSLDGKTAVQLWRRIYPVQVACKSGWCSSSWISVLSPYP